MSRPREPLIHFRLWVLLAWMAYISFISAAFVVASGAWAKAVSLSTLAALAVAAVVTLSSERGNRAFAAAFLVVCVTFLAASNGALRFLSVYASDVPTTAWLDQLAEKAHPGKPRLGSLTTEQAVAERVLLHGVAMGLATLAAYVSRGVYVLRQRPQSTRS